MTNLTAQPLPSPEPASGLEAYQAEREMALASSPERRRNHERYLLARNSGADVDYLPVKLDIETVSRCNFRCDMCQVSDWPNGRRAADMALEDFKRLIDQQYGLMEIKLQGMGEPTLGRDTFVEMIRYARARHIWVRSVTNASLLDKSDNYRKIIDADINELQISIDGADKETFESIRRGAEFERVTGNCKLINEYCEQQGVSPTKMWTVVQQNNAHQLPALVDLAAELKFKSMVFSTDMVAWGQEKWNKRLRGMKAGAAFDYRFGMTLVERGRRLGVNVSFWRTASKYAFDKPENLCPWPFERAYISSDMRVVPCCMIADPDTAELGSAIDFSETWHGDSYRKFRRDHETGNVPKICRYCYADSG